MHARKERPIAHFLTGPSCLCVMNLLIDNAEQTMDFSVSSVPFIGLLIVAVIALLLIVAVGLAVFAKSKSRRRAVVGENLTIDISQLETRGPAEHGPVLEVYGVPARLAVCVIAPLGRGTSLPPTDRMRSTMDLIIPEFSSILDRDRPIFRRWGPQLSAQGFPQFFSKNLELPGNKGQGTPWCGICGRFQAPSGAMLVGLVLCAAKPNGLAQIQVEHEGQWHDVLRIRR